MQYFLLVCLISVAIHLSVAPPVNQKTNNGEQDDENEVQVTEEVEMDMEYRRYLMEVVQALESDPEFRTKLEQAHEEDIRTGRIAEQLEFVNHNVRTKLDELKREELERLRHLATRENELRNGLDIDHLDHTNTRTFEIQDLKKLIAKTTKDLALADERRREEFKNHEMEKQFQEQEKLKHMSDAEKQKYEEELQALKEKQKKHQPIHHPGSKHQLEEVWEKEDHMETEEFNPRTFFYFHDVDGNGVWDQDEVKALFLKELDKLYALGTSQDDMLKRVEEMERMREHVFNEADLNKDGLISYEEFLKQTKKPEFQRDEGWQSLDEQQIYTPEEYEQYQKQTQMLANAGMHPNQASGGVVDPSYGHVPVAPGAVPPQVDPNHQQYQGQIHPQYYQQPQVINQQQFHNQIPQQPQQPQQQYHPNLSQQQFHGQMPPNQPYQHMQMPQGQVPVEQLHPVPHQGQVQQNPPVPQLHQGQVQQNLPVPQLHQGQVQQNPPVLQQPAQVPVEHNQQQAPNFQQQQNVVNQVPQNVQSNEVPQHKSPSQLNIKSAQPAVQQNKI